MTQKFHSFVSICPREMKAYVPSKTCTLMFIDALVTKWKQLKCPSNNGWINKMWCYPYNGIFGEKKEQATDTWMNLKHIMINERSQTQKITNCMIHFI